MTATATYSPEDNKLRLYVGRVPRDDYERLRAAGFVSTPKQDCDFVATWTPSREDLAREFLDEGEDIGDEDYSPEERAADRAERFSDYRDKRRAEAGGAADTFESGPSAFGHQNRARAERQAARHDRSRVRAVSQWSKAEYWQERTAGVISHALYKSSASVRRSRILTIEADLRAAVASYTPTDNPPHIIHQQEYNYAKGEYLHDGAAVPHVWCGPKGRGGRWVPQADLPAIEAAYRRWVEHYELRLTYERAMLAEEGGTAAEVEIEPGGWIKVGSDRSARHLIAVNGWAQVLRVNRSPVTKRVTSVVVHGRDPFGWADYAEQQKIRELIVNIERSGEDVYRAPTDAERETFQATTKAKKAEAKASKPKAPPLINPTDEAAEWLQSHWNARAKSRYEKAEMERYGKVYGDFVPSTVVRMTQAEYSAVSKGTYSRYETVDVCEHGFRPETKYGQNIDPSPVAFKVRKTYGDKADRVVILTDKPQKLLPKFAPVQPAKAEQPEPVNV